MKYVLLLRGVNVGTKNSLPMADLRAMLEKIGRTEVTTYIQSGNAALSTSLSKAKLLKACEQALAKYMGRPVATTVRTAAELDAIIAGNPFAGITTEPQYLCVTFLSGPPHARALATLNERDWSPEAFQVAGSEVYSWHPNGQGSSELAAALDKAKFDGTTTRRNWNTVLKLRDLLAAR